MAAIAVRSALIQELPLLEQIERQAATRFDSETVADGLRKRTVPLGLLHAANAQGLVWVCVADGDNLIGFLVAEELDGNLHISEMGVLPSHGRRGAGAALLCAVRHYASQAGFRGISLTTFAEVPWNKPFYEKNSFRQMLANEVGPSLGARIEQERALGLTNRVAMFCTPAPAPASRPVQGESA